MHFIDARYIKGIDFFCKYNEQCTSMAVDGFARSNGWGSMVTSGPYATNLITGVSNVFDGILVCS